MQSMYMCIFIFHVNYLLQLPNIDEFLYEDNTPALEEEETQTNKEGNAEYEGLGTWSCCD